ncbi:MAG: biotin/lipoyl-binding protein, partial [Opitutae bacterium]|nr:biotin/lipoyl-binding protein [Opitutae bacterium]
MKKAYIATGLGIAVLAGILVLGPGRTWIGRLAHGGANATSAAEAQKTAQKPAPQPPAVTLENVTRGVFRRFITLTGTVEAATVAGLASPAEGPVLECSVREGDRVRAGQAIVRIGRQASALALRASVAEELRRQQVEYRRVVTLVEGKALPADQLDLAKSSLERAKAAMVQADQSAGDYVVTAPWGGIVSQVRVADGNFVAPRAPLVDLYD